MPIARAPRATSRTNSAWRTGSPPVRLTDGCGPNERTASRVSSTVTGFFRVSPRRVHVPDRSHDSGVSQYAQRRGQPGRRTKTCFRPAYGPSPWYDEKTSRRWPLAMQGPEAAEAGLALAAPAFAALVAGPDVLERRAEAASQVDDALLLEGAGEADDLDAVGRRIGERVVHGADVGGRVVGEGDGLFLVEAGDEPCGAERFGVGGGDLDEDAVAIGDPDGLRGAHGHFVHGQGRAPVDERGRRQVREPRDGEDPVRDLIVLRDLRRRVALALRGALAVIEGDREDDLHLPGCRRERHGRIEPAGKNCHAFHGARLYRKCAASSRSNPRRACAPKWRGFRRTSGAREPMSGGSGRRNCTSP